MDYLKAMEQIEYQINYFHKRTNKMPNVVLFPQNSEFAKCPFDADYIKNAVKVFGIPIRRYDGKEITVGYLETPPNDRDYVVMPKNHGRKEAKQNFQEWLRKTNLGLKLNEGEVIIGVEMPNCVIYDEFYNAEAWKLLREKVTKPPLGVKPKRIAKLERAIELHAAIGRYLETDTPIKREWTKELDELVSELDALREATK